MDPYRSSAKTETAAPPRRRLPNDVRPPTRRIRMRKFSDGSTRLRLKPQLSGAIVLLCFVSIPLALAVGVLLLVDHGSSNVADRVLGVLFQLGALALLYKMVWQFAGGEELVVSRDGLFRRHRLSFKRTGVFLLADVSTAVLSGESNEPRLDLQLGRRRVQLAIALDMTSDELRFIATQLRAAIDRARAA